MIFFLHFENKYFLICKTSHDNIYNFNLKKNFFKYLFNASKAP